MSGFVQIIEFRTSRIDEVEALLAEVRSRLDDGSATTPRRGLFTGDRDNPGRYLSVIEFASHEAAMRNSARPEVADFAARLAKLCDEPPTFHNLDLREAWTTGDG
jgi:quinol monooxygenase YgiN